MRQWRYNDLLRELDDSLESEYAKEAQDKEASMVPPPPEEPAIREGGLQRFMRGDTACQGVDDIKVAAEAMAPELIREHMLAEDLKESVQSKFAKLEIFESKLAASRLDKEVLEGNVSYSDVDPRIPKAMGSSGIAKRVSRAGAMEPAARDALSVDRRREINSRAFEAKVREGVEHPGAKVTSKPFPGMHAATVAGGGTPTVHAPRDAGQFVRTIDRPLGTARAVAGSFFPEHSKKLFTAEKPVDKTLRHAVLEHELGEASEVGRLAKGTHAGVAHASHFGVEPVIRENHMLHGDPEAQHVMKGLRGKHQDDALTQKILRGVGAHPDAPIPVGGRQHRAAEREIARRSKELHSQTKQKALVSEALSTGAEAVHSPHRALVPKSIKGDLRSLASTGKEITDAGTRTLPDLLGHAKKVWNQRGAYSRLVNWMK